MLERRKRIGSCGVGFVFIVLCLVIPSRQNTFADHTTNATGVSETQFVEQGYQHLQRGNYELALEFFNKAISQEGISYVALLGRGQTFYRLNRLGEAVEDASRAITLDPRIPLGYMLRGSLYGDLGKEVLSNDDITQAITRVSVLRNKGVMANKPFLLGNLYTARSIGFMKLGRHEEALADLEIARDLGGNPVSIFSQRGRIYTKLGQYKRALDHYSQALQLNPSHAISLLNRGAVYRCVGNPQKAIEDLTQLLSFDPKDIEASMNIEAHIERAFAFSQLDQLTQAANDFHFALNHGKEDPGIYLEMASIYYRQGQLSKALDANERAIHLDVNHEMPFGYFQRGYYLIEIKKISQARKAFEQGIRLAVKADDRLAIQDSLDDLEVWRTSSEKRERSERLAVESIIKSLTVAKGKMKEKKMDQRSCMRGKDNQWEKVM